MSRSLKQVAIFIAIGGGLLDISLALLYIHQMSGNWGVLVGLLLLPYTWGYFPFYALFVHGSWLLLLIAYGSITVSFFLLEIAERLEGPQRLPPEPPTKPVTTNENSASTGIFLVSGLILVAIILSRSNSTMVAEQALTNRPTFTATSTPLPSATPTQSFISLKGCVTYRSVRIRNGPGVQYETIGGLVSGMCMWLLDRNLESDWVYLVTENGKTGWVATSLLTIDGDVNRLSVREVSEDWGVKPTLTPKP